MVNTEPRILVVDDNESVRSYIADLLKKEGWAIDTADSGRHALDLLKAGLDPDVILLDVMMPGLGGMQTLERIRNNFEKIPVEKFRQVLDVNLVGTFLLCQAALPHLRESGGNIVNTSSTSALAGMPYGAAYGSSKGGVSALTRTLAVEFAKQGIRCNAVVPGSIRTAMGSGKNLPEEVDMQLVLRAAPLDKPRKPEVVASVIAMLASEDGAHINGEEIRVDGGTLS